MNILVIGNGFDIAHELKTSYKHFLDFSNSFINIYEEQKKKNQQSWSDSEDRTYVKFILDMLKEAKNNEIYDNIVTELYELLNNNCWLNHFNEVNVPGNWVDFEKEISRIIQRLDERIKYPNNLHDRNALEFEYEIEKNAYIKLDNAVDYLTTNTAIKSIKSELLKDLNSLTRALEIYILYYVEDKEMSDGCPQLDIIKELEIDNIISFNYTDTYERIYGNDKTGYDYIHGKANKKGLNARTCNMILGIDEYLDWPDKDTKNTFIEFKKFYQRIYKKTGCEYRRWIDNVNNANNLMSRNKRQKINLYFYGHSLDKTDKDIIAELILNEDVKTTVFYHSRESLGNLISNLVVILGEDEVIKRTGGRESYNSI